MDTVLGKLLSLRMPTRKYYIFPPGWRVPEWIEDIRPNEAAGPNWKKGYGRFVSLTFVIRKKHGYGNQVFVYPIGMNVGMIFKVSNGTCLHGGPTCLNGTYMFSFNGKCPCVIMVTRYEDTA